MAHQRLACQAWRCIGGEVWRLVRKVGNGFRPAEAAAALGVPPSTLRLYSVRFGELLSSAAATPKERSGGRPGFRLYSDRDLDVLREGKVLLGRGLTYEESLLELKQRWSRSQRQADLRARASASSAEPETPYGARGAIHSGDSPKPQIGEPCDTSASDSLGYAVVIPDPARTSVSEGQWVGLASTLLSSLGGAQAVAEEWRRIVEERNAELAILRERLEDLEERRRRSWWRRLFGY
ncbi:MAG: helix-turn-helix domain-containing protein [Chloroflexota bacterium]